MSMQSEQILKGINVEMEHTHDREIAKKIALDHLNEDPIYYDKLELIEGPTVIPPDPRGDGPVEDPGSMRNGQPNIIDYSNKEPLLFGAGENSSHEYPGKIVINNESNYVDREVKHDQTGTGTARTGESQPLNDKTQPTIPTGGPKVIPPGIDNNKHGDNFNHNLNEDITINPPEANRQTNEEYLQDNEILIRPYGEAGFREEDHPRGAKGSANGGQFVKGDGGAAAGGDAGPNLLSQIQLKYTTTIQGKTIAVNGNQKKLWEKHTSEEQRNDPDFTTDYGKQLMDQAKDQDKPSEPKPKPEPKEEPKTEPKTEPGENWDSKIDRDIYKDLPGDASATAKDRLFPYQERQKVFAETEELNGQFSDLNDKIHSKAWYKEDYEEKLQKFYDDPESHHASNEDTFKHNIKIYEEEISKLEKQREEVREELLKKGKMEYQEVQQLLKQKQTYVDDLKRRKEGSAAYWKDQGQISAHDRAIDQYRTGKKEGHFPGSDYDAHLAKRREENRRDYEQQDKERQEKKSAKNEKMTTQNEEAFGRLKAAGLDIDKKTGKFNTIPTDKQYKLPEKIASTASAAEHKEFLQDYKQVLQNQKDMLQIRINKNTMEQGYASSYEVAELKEMTWKNSHFVEDHGMVGVAAFNDGDKSTFAEYQNRYQNSTNLSKSQVKEIKLYKTGGPRMAGRRAGFVTMGSWDNKGGVSLFFNSKSARKKMEEVGIHKDDWLTTSDHEFAHADWQGVTDLQGQGQKYNNIQAARESFIADVNDEYNNPDFKLHSYTDTYRNDRKEQLLANEAHSKIREFEIDGSLSTRLRTAEATIEAAQEFGEPTTTLGKEQIVSARGLIKLVDGYHDLRGEMNKL